MVRVVMVACRGDRCCGVGSRIGVHIVTGIVGRYTRGGYYCGDQAAAMERGHDGENVGRV